MILADQWYASGTFWTVAGVVVTLVLGVATMWLSWSAAKRPRLDYAMQQAVPLINAEQQRLSRVQVQHDGKKLNDPYLVTLTLANRSRKDIPTTAFDRKPLRLDVGTPILERWATSVPDTLKCPAVDAEQAKDGTAVLIGPGKIGSGQQITITLVVDGAKPVLVPPLTSSTASHCVKGPEPGTTFFLGTTQR